MSIPVNKQGKCVVEWSEDASRFLIMFPDGCIETAKSKSSAEGKCKKWLRDHGNDDAINVGMIEWRNGCELR